MISVMHHFEDHFENGMLAKRTERDSIGRPVVREWYKKSRPVQRLEYSKGRLTRRTLWVYGRYGQWTKREVRNYSIHDEPTTRQVWTYDLNNKLVDYKAYDNEGNVLTEPESMTYDK